MIFLFVIQIADTAQDTKGILSSEMTSYESTLHDSLTYPFNHKAGRQMKTFSRNDSTECTG